MTRLPALLCFAAFICVTRLAEAHSPAFFLFGDSLLDTGNNNKLLTLARADHYPYGRDFIDHRPTGRFSNGELSVDYIATFMGLPFPPPYLFAGDNILGGVNFASSSSGILNSTGDIYGVHIPFPRQVQYFSDVKQQLISSLGLEKASSLISESLFYINIGSNDYIINYFLFSNRRSPLQYKYRPVAFQGLLLQQLQEGLVDLYNMGARKIAVVSFSVLGCIPWKLFTFKSKHGECISFLNDQAKSFNTALLSLIKEDEVAYSDAHFVYLNSFDMVQEIINDPSSYGFRYKDRACCGYGRYNGAIPCVRETPVCEDASEYMFWDYVHPSTALNAIIAKRLWEGSGNDAYPMNLRDLVAL